MKMTSEAQADLNDLTGGIPYEIWEHILCYLDPKDRLNFKLVNSIFCCIIDEMTQEISITPPKTSTSVSSFRIFVVVKCLTLLLEYS